MASVSSLDADVRRLRLERYTPQAADEVKRWIESTLDESLPSGDLLESLKDGVALCKLANLVLRPPGIRFKQSSMPFVQRENISHFLRACEMPPLNMPSHDRFLTVDLYDAKDPAQVVQCIQAFSRAANAVDPARFQEVIGPRKGSMSPTRKTGANGASPYQTSGYARSETPTRPTSLMGQSQSPSQRALSPAFTEASSSGLSRSGTTNSGISSWSRKSDEGYTTPAWNIAQYGYMGGASQGNQGIAFGSRRQLVSQQPDVPSREAKERARLERQHAEAKEQAEAERRRKAEVEAGEEEARLEEQRRWEAETRKAREREKAEVDAERRRWEEQERRWKQEEESRQREELATQGHTPSKDQYLDQNRPGQQGISSRGEAEERRAADNDRVKELERQLEEAKERERRYLEEREGRQKPSSASPASQTIRMSPATTPQAKSTLVTTPRSHPSRPDYKDEEEFVPGDERSFVTQQAGSMQTSANTSTTSAPTSTRPLPNPRAPSPLRATENSFTPPTGEKPVTSIAGRDTRLESPAAEDRSAAEVARQQTTTVEPSNPVAVKSAAPAYSPGANRTDRFLSSNPAPSEIKPQRHTNAEMTSINEQADEDRRRAESQQKTKAGGWASKSLLEREMERERERQREWEEDQIRKGKRLTPSGPRTMGR